MKQLPTRVDGVGDRDQMLIKLARRDRVEQLTLRILQTAIVRLRPQHRVRGAVGFDAHALILTAAADARTVR